jgi:hypothetical protein
MSITETSQLQTAIYSALTGNTALMATITGVYDYVAPNTATPYIVIGDVTDIDSSYFTSDSRETYIDLHIWSSYLGKSQLHSIAKAITGIIGNKTLTLATSPAKTCFLFYDDYKSFQDPDDTTIYHGVLTFHAFV